MGSDTNDVLIMNLGRRAMVVHVAVNALIRRRPINDTEGKDKRFSFFPFESNLY